MGKKLKKNKKSTLGIIAIIAIIIILIVLFYINKKEDKIFESKQECTELEEIALENYIQNINISMLQDTESTLNQDEIKISYAINEYLKRNPNKKIDGEILVKGIYDEYSNIFEGNKENILTKIEEIMIREGIITLNPKNQKQEKQEVTDTIIYENVNTFKTLDKVTKLGENEYKLTIDIVQEVNIDALKNYYMNNREQLGIYNEIINEQNWKQHINKKNYKESAKEIKQQTLIVKITDGKILITDIK